jgi:SAM-dependent methyltransferase
MLKPHEDAFGRELFDYMNGQNSCEIIERDDGYLDVNADLHVYFEPFENWPAHHRHAIRLAKGRVLDIGCGAGRHAIYLQQKGREVTGIDVSPLAVKVSGMRGLRDARVQSITKMSPRLGCFDAALMLANNFGLVGNPVRAKWLLKRLHRFTSAGAVVLAESTDPYTNATAPHKQYQQRNRERGRMPGQLRVRIRYRQYQTPWFDYLLVSKKEMRRIVSETGWHIDRFIDSGETIYIAVLKKV